MGSEAVTREEVVARQEVKDAISNLYLTKMVDSIEEVYRCIKMMLGGDSADVVIIGGFIESCKREKHRGEMKEIYDYAKQAGLNTQGIVIELTKLTDLPTDLQGKLITSFQQDPYKSPLVVQLQQQLQQSMKTIEDLNRQIALLRIQATQRLERQGEAIAADERMKRLEVASKQNIEEMKQTQEANMLVLQTLLDNGDYDGARKVVEAINAREPHIVSDPEVGQYADANTSATMAGIRQDLVGSGAIGGQQPNAPAPAQPQAPAPQPPQPQGQPQQGGVPQPPKAAVTLFNDK